MSEEEYDKLRKAWLQLNDVVDISFQQYVRDKIFNRIILNAQG